MTIVFDLGGVVFYWRPNTVFRDLFPGDIEKQKKYHQNLIGHPDWHLFDQGRVNMEETAERAAARLATTKEEVQLVLERLTKSLLPIEETVMLLKRIKKTEHRLLCLSNMPTPAIEFLEATYDLFHLFDACVISSRVNMAKPDREIFEHLLNKYALTPDETVFIDDSEKNIEAAQQFGIGTLQFADPKQCERELIAQGIFL